jgi:hypothetical protein
LQPADPLPGQARERLDAHYQHLGIDLDRMGALLHAEYQEGVGDRPHRRPGRTS